MRLGLVERGQQLGRRQPEHQRQRPAPDRSRGCARNSVTVSANGKRRAQHRQAGIKHDAAGARRQADVDEGAERRQRQQVGQQQATGYQHSGRGLQEREESLPGAENRQRTAVAGGHGGVGHRQGSSGARLAGTLQPTSKEGIDCLIKSYLFRANVGKSIPRLSALCVGATLRYGRALAVGCPHKLIQFIDLLCHYQFTYS